MYNTCTCDSVLPPSSMHNHQKQSSHPRHITSSPLHLHISTKPHLTLATRRTSTKPHKGISLLYWYDVIINMYINLISLKGGNVVFPNAIHVYLVYVMYMCEYVVSIFSCYKLHVHTCIVSFLPLELLVFHRSNLLQRAVLMWGRHGNQWPLLPINTWLVVGTKMLQTLEVSLYQREV